MSRPDPLQQLEERKKALEQEIQELQSEINGTVDNVKTQVEQFAQPVALAKKFPLTSVSLGVLAGFFIAKTIFSGSSSSKKAQDRASFGDALKKAAYKRIADTALELIQQRVLEKYSK